MEKGVAVGRVWGYREGEEQSELSIFPELSFGTESIKILIKQKSDFHF